MIKKLVLLFSMQLFGFYLVSQNYRSISPEAYDELKVLGKLDPTAVYRFPNNNINGISEKIKPNIHQLDSFGILPCNCLVPLDTTFSIAEFIGYSLTNGYRNDDASTGLKLLPFNFQFYGNNYNAVYINNNGNISFNSPYSAFSSTGFPNTTFNMIAPFWADVDTRNMGSGLVYYKITDHYMIVKWDSVGYYSNQADKKNTFQLIISDGTDPIIPNNNNVAFCYGDMQWTTGNASQGVNGFGGVASTTGVNLANGINYAQITRSDSSGYLYDGPYGLNDGVDILDYQSYFFDVSDSLNIPATAYDSICDTMIVVSNFATWTVFINAMESTDSAFMNVITAPDGMTFTVDTLPSSLRINVVYNPTQIGNHFLKIAYWDSYNVNNVNFYEISLDVQSINTVGLSSLTNLSNDLIVYPNPAGSELNVKLLNHQKITKLIIRNIEGKAIEIKNDLSKVSLNQLDKGIYFIEISDISGKRYFNKFIKE